MGKIMHSMSDIKHVLFRKLAVIREGKRDSDSKIQGTIEAFKKFDRCYKDCLFLSV
jgi:hypothetical protein